MKLKRLLLRYSPPGIGLEVIDEEFPQDEAEVIHKDLPAVEDVKVPAQVFKLVDELLEDEAELLTRKKHDKSLL